MIDDVIERLEEFLGAKGMAVIERTAPTASRSMAWSCDVQVGHEGGETVGYGMGNTIEEAIEDALMDVEHGLNEDLLHG